MMNCNKCKHRGSVPGDTHICCKHPYIKNGGLLDILGPFKQLPSSGYNKLNIRLNPHGVNKGWAMWPLNFDPIWVNNCDGYEDKD